jgi:hypothetical protein
LTHTLHRINAVQPTFVGAAPISQVSTWKEPNVTADGCEVGVFLQDVHLGCQALPMHEIIGVHTGDSLSTTVLDASVQGRHQSVMRGRQYRKTRVPVGKPAGASK